MIVHWPQFLFAVALLWLPRPWLRLGTAFLRRRRRPGVVEPWNVRERGDPRVYFRTEFAKLRNYVDLLRGAAGSLAFVGGLGTEACLRLDAGAAPVTLYLLLAVRALVLLAGLLLQTTRIEKRRVTFYPPVFYLAGLSAGLCDLRGAAFAFAFTWAVSPMFGNAQAFLTAYAIALVGFGHLFAGHGDLSAAYAGGLAFAPVLLSLLARRPLIIFTRKSSRVGAPP